MELTSKGSLRSESAASNAADFNTASIDTHAKCIGALGALVQRACFQTDSTIELKTESLHTEILEELYWCGGLSGVQRCTSDLARVAASKAAGNGDAAAETSVEGSGEGDTAAVAAAVAEIQGSRLPISVKSPTRLRKGASANKRGSDSGELGSGQWETMLPKR